MSLTQVHRKGFLESKIDDKPESDFTTEKCKELFDAIEEHHRVRKLSENPLLLTFLYHVYKYNLELPRRRVELYRLSVNLMLDWDTETTRPTHIQVKDRDAKKGVLKTIAYYYHTSQRRELPEAEPFGQVQIYFRIILYGTFFEKALEENANIQAASVDLCGDQLPAESNPADFALRVSYLLHGIVTDNATRQEQAEFWQLVIFGAPPAECEWLESSGLTLLNEVATPPETNILPKREVTR